MLDWSYTSRVESISSVLKIPILLISLLFQHLLLIFARFVISRQLPVVWPHPALAMSQLMEGAMFEFLAGLTLEAVLIIAAEAAIGTVAAKAASDIYDYAFRDEEDD